MKKIWLLSYLMILFFSCSSPRATSQRNWQQDSDKIKVLSTIAMIDDLVRQIGGDYVTSIPLIKGELDPHSYQLVKGDDEKLLAAQVIFYNGLGLEHGPSLQHHLQANPKAVSIGDEIAKKYPELIIYDEGQLDPHIWMDASIWSKAIPVIVSTLSKADPVHQSYYELNGKSLFNDMLKTHQNIYERLQRIPEEKRYLVTSHDAFNYFTRAYLAQPDEIIRKTWKKRFAAPEGLAPESQLSTLDIQQIMDHIEKHKIKVIFPESNVSKDSIRKILQALQFKKITLRIADVYLYADAMGDPGSDGDSYLKMIEHNAQAIAKNLEDNP